MGDWIRTLNDHFYVFPDEMAANSFQLRQVSAFGETKVRVITLKTQQLPRSAQDKLRLSRLNGGSINGMAPRGRDTYLPLSAWMHREKPKELGFVSGLSSDEVRSCAESEWVLRALA